MGDTTDMAAFRRPLRATDLERLVMSFSTPKASTGFARANGFVVEPTRYDIVWAARRNKLLATLASAWRDEGIAIETPLRVEIEDHDARRERYTRLTEELRREVGGIVRFKGPVLDAVYPPTWARRTGDIDLMVDSFDGAVAIGTYLTSKGWRVIRATVLRRDDGPLLALNIIDPSSARQTMDYDWVQLGSFTFRGDATGLPTQRTYAGVEEFTPAARTLMALVEELTQRRAIARDALDAYLLGPTLTERDWALWAPALTDLAMWPEWRKLHDIARRVGEVPVPTTSLPSPEHERQDQRVRRLRAARRAALRTVFMIGLGRRGLPTLVAYRAGLPVSGAPTLPPQPRVRVRRRGTDLVLEAPFGTTSLAYYGVV